MTSRLDKKDINKYLIMLNVELKLNGLKTLEERIAKIAFLSKYIEELEEKIFYLSPYSFLKDRNSPLSDSIRIQHDDITSYSCTRLIKID